MTTPADVLSSRVATWEEYQAVGEDTCVEWIDGRLVVSPSPRRTHQRLSRRLATALEQVLPEGLEVDEAWSWKPGDDEFVPDVIVYPSTEEVVRFTGMPLLIVEVLSSNRTDDLVVKASKYAALGLPRYWVVDPDEPVLDAYVLDGGTSRREAQVVAGRPVELPVGPVALTVDLAGLLR